MKTWTPSFASASAQARPKPLLEAQEALSLIRNAGGVASWAHPSYDFTLSALPELRGWGLSAIEAIYPQTQIQLCIVHLVRHSLFYVSHKDRKEVATDLKMIYQAPTLEEADYQLGKFADKWSEAYPMVVKSWRQNWVRVIPMFSFAPEIRKAIYTTNTIESLNYCLAFPA